VILLPVGQSQWDYANHWPAVVGMDRPRNKVTRSSSSAAYKKRRSTAIGVHKVNLNIVTNTEAIVICWV